ncbi:hypothetical protein KJ966_04015 [bacterium]|nr:hypothetical protein [bacterium]
MKNYKKKRHQRTSFFNPNHGDIKNAINKYLNNGGKITKITVDEQNYKDFLSLRELPSAADEFLNGN